MIQTKCCCTCKQEKPIEEFGKLAKSTDGYSGRCVMCWRVMQKAYCERHPDRVVAKRKKYYEANKKEILAKQKPKRAAYAVKNRDAILGRKKAYRLSNMDKVREGQRRWDRANLGKRKQYYEARKERDPEGIRASWKKNYNKDKAVASAKAWRLANPEKVAELSADYRARKQNAKPEWANGFFIAEAYRLSKLRSQMFGFKWEVDHIVPLNGDVVCGLHVEHNLQVIPAVLNRAKSNKLEVASWQF